MWKKTLVLIMYRDIGIIEYEDFKSKFSLKYEIIDSPLYVKNNFIGFVSVFNTINVF